MSSTGGAASSASAKPEESLRLVLCGDGGAEQAVERGQPPDVAERQQDISRPAQPALARLGISDGRLHTADHERVGGREPAESMPFHDRQPALLVFRESRLVARRERADHHQRVPGTARDRLGEAEQASLGRLGEAAERQRPPGCVSDDVGRSLRGLAQAAGGEAVAQRAERPLVRTRDAPTRELEVLQRDRGLRDADIVAHGVERVDCALGLAHGGVDLVVGGRAVDPVREQLDRRAQRIALRSGCAAQGDPVGQEELGLAGPAGLGQGNPQIGQQIQAAGVGLRQEHGRAAEQITTRDEVEAGECPQARRCEQLTGACRERGGVRVTQAELLAQAQRALEVARNRFADVGLLGVRNREPVRELLVELRPPSLREASVGGVDDQRVHEAPAPGRLVLGLDEAAAVERRDRGLDLLAGQFGGEVVECRGAEPAALDGGSFQGQARAAVEAVEPRGQQRLKRSRDVHIGIVRAEPAAVDEQPLIGEHRRELLQVERIPLGRLADPVDDGRGGVHAEQQLPDRASVVRRERREGHRERTGLPGGPGGTLLHELGPGEAEEERRGRALAR